MANWYGTARTNYFRVRDLSAFKAWLGTVPEVKLIEDLEGRVGFMVDGPSDSGGWPSFYLNTEGDDTSEFEWLPQDVAPFLADGEVAVFMEAGAEKLRYITGCAIAVHSSGEVEEVQLSDIYKLANKRWGANPTSAEF